MPGKIKVKVLAGRNLPVMDRASDTTDAFVEIKFGGVTHKTDVCRKSLNPHWSSTEWYRFEVDESELQDEPLQLRLMDHDTYSANDAIGKVVISLAPLLAREADNAKGTTGPPGGAVLSGWIPVFDTMHGIRGELNVIVKVELFSDFNKYKTSSCGVQFFHCPMIPPGYKATSIHGFVEELVVNDDPEYQWIDKIRTPRASNEARQVAFIKLGNQVQRLVGLKAAELGANAVVGYQQEFDLEGEAGVVARAIGTAVSITPLPTPSHPVNMISCTQQQLKKCLDLLATDDESVTDLNHYYKTHQEELAKMINLLNPKGLLMLDSQENADDDDEKELVRQTSMNSYAGSMSLYQDDFVSRDSLRHLSEDQTDLNKLLNRKDEEESDSSGPIQKIKKLKTNFFTKRFTKHKGDKKDEKDKDTVSLKSNSSDTSRISLYDIKNEFKKLKRLKKPKFRKAINKEDEGEGMASILARSVIHARTTLACITETQDSQAENSPSSTLRRISESEPNIHVDDDKNIKIVEDEPSETDSKKVPEIQFSSLKNISSEDLPSRERVRKTSESCPTSPMSGMRTDNLLKLPGDKGYYGSVSSALSGDSSIYTTTEDEDESSDLKTDTDEALETTSSIVKSVLKYKADPEYVAEMGRKLTVLQNTPLKITQSAIAEFDKRTPVSRSMEAAVDETEIFEASKQETKEFEYKVEKAEDNATEIEPIARPSTLVEECVSKPNTHYIKIHNPFANRKTSASISCPSSPVDKHNFVYRSSKRIKDKLAKISKSNMIKSISHISLFPKKKEAKTLSQPGSNSDVPSCPSKCPSETVLGSYFLSYSDLLSLDQDKVQANKLCKSDEIGRSKFSMYIGSEPVSRCSISGPSHPHSRDEHDHKKEKHSLKSTGLIHTAMETMLIEKVESLLLPTSPTIVNTKFFDDVSERLEEHKNSGATMRQLQSTTSSTTPRIVAVTPKRLSEDLTSNIDKLIEKHQEEAKVHVPQTLLLEVAHGGRTDTSDSSLTSDSHYESSGKKSAHKKKDSRGSISTLMDKVHFHPHIPHVFHHKKDGHDIKSGGLIHAAMQTMLIDRAQSMIPDTPEPIPIHTEPDFGEIGKHKHHNNDKEHDHKYKESKGLVHSALQTILMENVQTVLPDTEEPIPVRTDPDFGEEPQEKHNQKHEKDSTGLVHSALQTMLIENVQTVLPDTEEPIPIRTDPDFGEEPQDKHNHKHTKESTGLVHSALQTMLIDNIQSVLPNTIEPIPIRTEEFDDTKSQKSHGSIESTGLVHTALQTMLIDNVKSILPDSNEPIPIRIEDFDDTKSQKNHGATESTGLVHSAMETILLDKAQALINPKTEHANKKDGMEHSNHKVEDLNRMQSAMETMLIDRMQTMFPKPSETADSHIEKIQNNDIELKSTSLVKHAMQILIDKTQAAPATDESELEKDIENFEPKPHETLTVNIVDVKVKSWSEDSKDSASDSANILKDRSQETKHNCTVNSIETTKKRDHSIRNIGKQKKDQEYRNKEIKKKALDERKKHFTRQDSVHSVTSQISKEYNTHKVTKASHHLSGLETIQSVECNDSFDHSTDVNTSFDAPSVKLEGSVDRTEARDRGGSLNTSAGNVGSGGGAILRPSMNSNNLDMLEYPFLTMTEYPPGFIVHIGGAVCARSVKLVDGGGESAARAAWWTELRTELRAHARALRCNAVIAYRDSSAICEDVCVLSASGTAVVINLDCDFNADVEAPTVVNGSKAPAEETEESCSIAHVPYSPGAGPYRAELSTCGGCRRARVPAVLLAACEKPNKLSAYPKSVMLTAVAARIRRAPPSAEPGARDISDQLPFLEYELHKLLLAKLRMQGANALFSLQTQIAIGDRCVMAVASGTAVKLTALPPPTPPRIKASEKEKDALEMQKALWDTFTANKTANGYDVACGSELAGSGALPEVEREEPPALDLCADRDACVLELDEAEDVETARALAKRRNHMQAFTNSLRPAADAQPLAFTQVSRARLALGSGAGAGAAAERQAARALAAAAYKLRRLAPAALHASLQLDLPEDEIQLVVSGTAVPLADPTKEPSENHSSQSSQNSQSGHTDGNDDDIFELDEEQMKPGLTAQEMVEDKSAVNGQVGSAVSLTTLCAVGAGGRGARRLCALRLLFVRETTAVRELGGLSGFLHTFTCEVLAILRAYTAALGGNALTSFYITQLMLQDNAHKNQGQCLLSVGGDVVHVSY